MKKISNILVKYRYIIFSVILVIAIACLFLIGQIKITTDMTNYLSKDSNTYAGLEIINQEFDDGRSSILKVMFSDLSEDETNSIELDLGNIPNVANISIETKNEYTLFTLTIPHSADSSEATTIYNTVIENYENAQTGGDVTTNNKEIVSPLLIILAFAVIMVILFLMCQSFIEPFLFLVTISIAILINFGTNIIFPCISLITSSIAGLLQFSLSLDFALILSNRYRQEKLKNNTNNKIDIMKTAIGNSFATIFGSAFTTIISLLVLVFISFTIGLEMGIVLAKGILLSFICIFGILPTLLILFNKVIEKTKKKSLHFNMSKIGSFSFSARKIIPIIFIIIFALSFFLRGGMDIGLSQPIMDKVNKIFPNKNEIVLVYENQDENNIEAIITSLVNLQTGEFDYEIESINSYSTTIGTRLSTYEFAYYTGIDSNWVNGIYNQYFILNGTSTDDKIAMYDLINFIYQIGLNDLTFGGMVTEESGHQLFEQITIIKTEYDQIYENFVGDNYSRLVITSTLVTESTETFNFFSMLELSINSSFVGNYYLVGSSALAYELNDTIYNEINLITILTIIAIFLVVSITFKSIIIPIILICIVQCAIFLTMGILSLFSGNIYFLAILIVQALLMGAAIDYGILYISNYKENRRNYDIKTATQNSYNQSIHTILTSFLALCLATFIVGITSSDSATSQICISISIGSIFTTTLIIFALPPIVALLDKFIIKIKN